jgi:hypothetical protein
MALLIAHSHCHPIRTFVSRLLSLIALVTLCAAATPSSVHASVWIDAQGGGQHLDVAADGTVYTLAADGQVFRYGGLPGSWQRVPVHTLQAFAVGGGDAMWGIDTEGLVWRFDHSVQDWIGTGGRGVALDVDPQGNAWVVAADQTIWRWDVPANGFLPVTGQLQDIAIGADGTVWGLDALGRSWKHVLGDWSHMGGNGQRIAVDAHGQAWLTAADGSVKRFDDAAGGFLAVATPGFQEVAVAPDGTIFGVVTGGSSIQHSSTEWVDMGGRWIDIDVDAHNVPWVVDPTGALFRFGGQAGSWHREPAPKLLDLAIGTEGSIWGAEPAGHLSYFDTDLGDWIGLGGHGVRIVVDEQDVPWAVAADGSVWKYGGQHGVWHRQPAPLLSDLAIGPDGSQWATEPAGFVSHFDTTVDDWVGTGGHGVRVDVDGASVAWVVAGNGTLWKHGGQHGAWQQVAAPPLRTISIAPDGTIWGIGLGLRILRGPAIAARAPVPGPPAGGGTPGFTTSWTQIPGDAIDVGAGADGSVWSIGGDRSVYRRNSAGGWDGMGLTGAARIDVSNDGRGVVVLETNEIRQYIPATDSWQQIPGQATDVGFGADGSLWIIGGNPSQGVWRWQTGVGGWEDMGANATRIDVAPNGTAYLVQSDGTIMQYGGSPGVWHLTDGGLQANDIAVGLSPHGAAWGAIWAIGQQDGIYRWSDARFGSTGNGWERTNGGSIAITADNHGNVLSVAHSGTIWQGSSPDSQ